MAFLGTGALRMSWGLHFSWNFFQGQVFGLPVSGLTLPGLVAQTATGPERLTGAAYGPEAGAVGIAFRFVVIALLFGWLTSPGGSELEGRLAASLTADQYGGTERSPLP